MPPPRRAPTGFLSNIMTNVIDHLTSGVTVIVAGIFGSKVSVFVADSITDATQSVMPSWLAGLQGPFGALIGLAVGLYWMSKRLDKAETKADRREEERDNDRKTLITVIVQNSAILTAVEARLAKLP